MRGAEEENARSAGLSRDAVDVVEIFERLKADIRSRPPGGGADGASGPLAARADAERLWSVAVDVPIERRPGPRGRVAYRVKSFLRRLMSWYVGPFAADQRNFNHQVLRLVDELTARAEHGRQRLDAVEAGFGRVDALEERAAAADERHNELSERVADARRVEEVEDRVLRLERARRSAGATESPGSGAQPSGAGAPPIDYFAFEARMRGTTVEIRERQRAYVDDFRDAAPVLDVGCGRGEFLALLREAGVEARGVDLDPEMAAFAAGEGLEVAHGDALAYLADLDDGSLGGIFCAQVVEHLPPEALVRFLALSAQKLRAGGVFVAETINPLSPLAFRNYFSDLSHAQPLVPETLALLAGQAGLDVDEIRYLHEPDRRLEAVTTGDEAADRALAYNVALLNEHVFAALDYALVARRP